MLLKHYIDYFTSLSFTSMHLLSCSQVTPTKTMKFWLCYVHGLLSYKALSMLYGNSTTTRKLTREAENDIYKEEGICNEGKIS